MAILIGREHPAAILRAEINRALTSHGSLVLVTGEAGVGKSALVSDAAGRAVTAGARVLSAACWEGEGAPGYWPWVQVVRRLRPDADVFAGARTPFELYDAVTALLVEGSREQPLVVVLEDLHWADTGSLKLLEFVARHAWFERLLVIGTHRQGESELSPELKATTVALSGLSRAEVGELVARTTGVRPGDELVGEIHRRTGGNPFFVEQTARLWQGGSPLATIPAGVRAAVERRLSRLSAEVRAVLRTAAVLGREFDDTVLAAAVTGRDAGAPPGQTVDVDTPPGQTAAVKVDVDTPPGQTVDVDTPLGQAVAAQLVAPAGEGSHAFVHDLVRETLYAELDEAGRRTGHAAALTALRSSDPGVDLGTIGRAHLTELARHAYLAAVSEAPALLLAAAQDAEARLADEEAVGHYRRALELVPGDERARRTEIELEMGLALQRIGEREEGGRAIEAAMAAARELDDPALLAHTALKLYHLGFPDFVREAHRRLVRGEAARIEEVGEQLSGLAADRARHRGDDRKLAATLLARMSAIWRPGTAVERAALAEELTQVAARSNQAQFTLNALSWHAGALLELGDPGHTAVGRTFAELAGRAGLPLFEHEVMVIRTRQALLQGRFDEARQLAEATRKLGEQPYVDGDELRWMQVLSAALLQGRFEEADTVLAEMRAAGSGNVPLFAGVVAAQRGDAAGALRQLTVLMAGGPDLLTWLAPLWLRFQAQAAALSRDRELCANARAAIVPYRGQWAVTSTIAVDGPFDHWIAVLDAALGRWEEAAEGFTAAYRAADRLDARPWSVESRARLAEVLLARGADPAGLLADVEREAAELGMRVRLPRPVAGSMGGSNVFRLEGGVWTLTFAGRTAHVPDAKGLHDLRALMGSPGAEIPAVELLNPAGGAEAVAARRMGGDAVLDDEAKARYRRRLDLLDEEIDRAAERGDDRRAAAYDVERQALLDELRRAAGLGGRSRRLGDEAERARKAVTNRIRNTLRQLGERHPELAAHLREAVSTGATCRYQPAEPVTWTW
ncbi:AAA family ATPase [Nonomuraea typhae]|uniref:AAA family ATPase n=1 Tax=Nonomuraea typhae TaxID=2603600 RepID=A0ABW7Z086_9ACTN